MTSFALDHAPKGTSRFARWEALEDPFVGSFRSTQPGLVQADEESEDEEKTGGDALAFVQAFKPGDELFSEMGGSSDNICAAVAARGCAVWRIPTFELKHLREEMGLGKDQTAQALHRLAVRDPHQFYPMRESDLKILQLRVRTRGYIMVQRDVRIKTQLRLLALQRDERLVEALPEATRDDQKKYLLGNPIFKGAQEFEDQLKREVGELLKGIPVYGAVFANIKGIGPLIAGALIAEMGDIRRFRSAAALKAYAGYHLSDAGTRPVRGQEHWNANLKQAVFKAVESFEKQKGSPWQELMATRKAYEKAQHPDKERYEGKDGVMKTRFNPGHHRNRAKRYVGQKFLVHIWTEWARFEGLEIVDHRLAA